MGRAPELGTTILCSTHGRRVVPGPGGTILHVAGNLDPLCAAERFIVRVERQADRAEVLGLLAALAGEDGDHA